MKKEPVKQNVDKNTLETNRRMELAKYLKRGDVMRIAKIAETLPQNVSNFISGRQNSSRIKEAFDAIASKRKSEFKARLEKELK